MQLNEAALINEDAFRAALDHGRPDGPFAKLFRQVLTAYLSHPAVAGAEAEPVLDSYLRRIWLEAGGGFHGPNVETGTMPEAKLLPFLRSLLAPAAPSSALPADAEGMRGAHITLGLGKVDITTIKHEGRTGVLFRPRDAVIPYGEPGELGEGKYWPADSDVVLWVEGDGPQVAIDALAALTPARTAIGGETDWNTRVEIAERFLMKYADGDKDRLLAGYEIQPIIRELANLLNMPDLATQPAPDEVVLREALEKIDGYAMEAVSLVQSYAKNERIRRIRELVCRALASGKSGAAT